MSFDFTVFICRMFAFHKCKCHVVFQRLVKYNCIKAMNNSLAHTRYRIGEVGIPDLRHFLYKAKSTAQYTSPEYEAPYITEEEQSRLFHLYHYLHGRIHSTGRPLKILFHVGQYETLLGWVSKLACLLENIYCIILNILFGIVDLLSRGSLDFDE